MPPIGKGLEGALPPAREDEMVPDIERRIERDELARERSGGLPDESPEDPVRDDNVFRPSRGRR